MVPPTFRIGDVAVPAMALGTMYFGTQVPTDRARACLDSAFELGARFWDTANNYAFWAGGVGDESEATIGDWLARRGAAVRTEVVIATKAGARPRTAGAGLDDVLGLSAAAVRGQVHDSLRRLRTEYVDVLYAHVDDPAVPLDETLGALGELVDEGIVRSVAASNLTAPRLEAAMSVPASHPYQALQQRFTYVRPDAGADLGPHVLLDEAVCALCDRYGLLRLGYAPLLSGAYTRADRPWPAGYGPSRRALGVLGDVAAAHSLDPGQAVLAWMVGRGAPVVPVVGVSTAAQVAAAWRAVGTALGPGETDLLDRARLELDAGDDG